MNAFCYDGIWSREHGLYITGQGQYDAPERDIEEVTVPGRDGNLFIDNGRFNSLDVTYSAFLRGHLPEKTRLSALGCLAGRDTANFTTHTTGSISAERRLKAR